jgi:hypothetical protein
VTLATCVYFPAVQVAFVAGMLLGAITYAAAPFQTRRRQTLAETVKK